jgi:arylsulfatase A-like enzyme
MTHEALQSSALKRYGTCTLMSQGPPRRQSALFRRPALLVVVLMLAMTAGCLRAAGTQQVGRIQKPNILLIVADDLGYADVGYNGGKIISTPNLDRLAASGVILEDFRTCPMCSPTRAGLLTGRWPLRFGLMRSVIPPWSSAGLPQSESTLPELLARGGYQRRALVGKWHLGHAKRAFLPLAHGFTRFYGHYNGAIDYFTHEREGELDWHRNDLSVAEEGYSTDLLGAEAVRLLQNVPSDKPWFMYLAFNAPHAPYQAKPEDLQNYPHIKNPDRRAYAAMVDCMDQAIGRILATIEPRRDMTNTLILFFSDNGGVARTGSNAPWRGAKLSVYEGGTRVCAAISWPAGGLTGGRKFTGRIGYIDVLPTVLAAAGIKMPDNLDGINVLPALRGETKLPARPWFSWVHQGQQAHASVHENNWKLVVQGDLFASGTNSPPTLELYNLEDDPGERTNVAEKHPDTVAHLRQLLIEFGKLQRPGVGPYDEGREGFKAPKDWIIQR